MIKKILPLGDPRLKSANKEIVNVHSKDIQQLIKDLLDTMRKEQLIGIASPQIGVNKQMFAIEIRNTSSRKNVAKDAVRVFINPKLIRSSKRKIVIWEGCGCTGDIFAPVSRSEEIVVEAHDQNGKKFRIMTNGLLARIILHELDHLSGIEFVQRVTDNSTFIHFDHYVKHHRNSKINIENSKITKLKLTYL